MIHSGIHHVTAIAGNARRNVEFYTRILGLRLVKKTVNFDDPGTYHFYYGDETGTPGTILTFFPWDHVAAGRTGIGETQETVFRVPESAIGYWTQRLIEKSVPHEAPVKRFGETLLSFKDPHGMRLALAGVPGIEAEAGWSDGEIPAEAAIRGFHSVNLLVADAAPTAAILTDVLGFAELGREGSLIRYRVAGETGLVGAGGIVDLHAAGGFLPARMGGGSVHHVAFRAEDDAAQAEMVKKLAENHNIHTTEQKDRNYFRSVYFREPGHVLFEIATDIPGFAADEPVAHLGEALKLPSFLEPHRARIEAVLPEIA
ncbi:ring-cleaving dioxygenase [Ancylobacter sp. 6x-1]|uniref:Ring-cleaving dioxygenase n=1 Tax=Ancylobacter crimeensis TaxID=2579147 RepID=A0ABT0D7M6_9HYPH|nr:ring-cleaving dioxygenase [Ancylobacter crimeensis]MCK0195955.1 ring-cleaving dioxygenase [Ancylobacter crimeensis]